MHDSNISFNPLEIGSYCNVEFTLLFYLVASFNPLEIGSYCNAVADKTVELAAEFQSP